MKELPIDRIKLSKRVRNAFQQNGIAVIADFAGMTKEQILSLPHFPKSRIDEVMNVQRFFHENPDLFCKTFIIKDDPNTDGSSCQERTMLETALQCGILSESMELWILNWQGVLESDRPDFGTGLTSVIMSSAYKYGINSMSVLAHLPYTEVQKIPKVGPKGLAELAAWFQEHACLVDTSLPSSKITEALLEGIEEQYPEFETKILRKTLLEHLKNYDDELLKFPNVDTEEFLKSHRLCEILLESREVLAEVGKPFCMLVMKPFLRFSLQEIIDLFPSVLFPEAMAERVLQELITIEYAEQIGSDYRRRLHTFEEFLDTMNERARKVVCLRIQGCTLTECGRQVHLSRERVNQIFWKEFKRKRSRLLAEDEFAYWYQNYRLDQKAMAALFDADEWLYSYYKTFYTPGFKDPAEMEQDPLFNRIDQEKYSKYMNSLYLLFEGEWVFCSILAAVRKAAQIICSNGSEIGIGEFIFRYQQLLRDNGLSCRKELRVESRPEFAAMLMKMDFILMSSDSSIRYYPIEETNPLEMVERLNLSQLRGRSVAAETIAQMNPELMAEFDLRNGYELYHYLKKTRSKWRNKVPFQLTFDKPPVLVFGSE